MVRPSFSSLFPGPVADAWVSGDAVRLGRRPLRGIEPGLDGILLDAGGRRSEADQIVALEADEDAPARIGRDLRIDAPQVYALNAREIAELHGLQIGHHGLG